MDVEMQIWYLDFCEDNQTWHHDLRRVPENKDWINVAFGSKIVIDYFCDMVDMMVREFGSKFTNAQILRLAECTPGLTVYQATPVPEDLYEKEDHMIPIWTRGQLEKHIEWKTIEE